MPDFPSSFILFELRILNPFIETLFSFDIVMVSDELVPLIFVFSLLSPISCKDLFIIIFS